MADWIDITAEANWQSGIMIAGGTGDLVYTDDAGSPMNVVDSFSADGIYYEFIGGIWTPTHVIGTPPDDGFVPFLRYVGPAYGDIENIRITAINRSTITDLYASGFSLYSTLGQLGVQPPGGTYASGEEFVLAHDPDGSTLQLNEWTNFPNGLLAHMMIMVAFVDFDHGTFAVAPRVLFDITKIEIFATPAAGFWTDFANCRES